MATNQKVGSSSPPGSNLNDLFRGNFTGTVWRGNQKVGSSNLSARATAFWFLFSTTSSDTLYLVSNSSLTRGSDNVSGNCFNRPLI